MSREVLWWRCEAELQREELRGQWKIGSRMRGNYSPNAVRRTGVGRRSECSPPTASRDTSKLYSTLHITFQYVGSKHGSPEPTLVPRDTETVVDFTKKRGDGRSLEAEARDTSSRPACITCVGQATQTDPASGEVRSTSWSPPQPQMYACQQLVHPRLPHPMRSSALSLSQ